MLWSVGRGCGAAVGTFEDGLSKPVSNTNWTANHPCHSLSRIGWLGDAGGGISGLCGRASCRSGLAGGPVALAGAGGGGAGDHGDVLRNRCDWRYCRSADPSARVFAKPDRQPECCDLLAQCGAGAAGRGADRSLWCGTDGALDRCCRAAGCMPDGQFCAVLGDVVGAADLWRGRRGDFHGAGCRAGAVVSAPWRGAGHCAVAVDGACRLGAVQQFVDLGAPAL